MKHELPDLPYAEDALEPHISAETLRYHHGKHHAKYVEKLNQAIDGTPYVEMSLDELVRRAPTEWEGIYENGAQAWNHGFYWNCLSPEGGGAPGAPLRDALTDAFGSLDSFREEFTQKSLALFGSGWAWLVQKETGELEIVSLGNAGNPMRTGDVPLLTCDLWEHAYYIDYRNSRKDYMEAFWKVVHWDFAEGLLMTPGKPARTARP